MGVLLPDLYQDLKRVHPFSMHVLVHLSSWISMRDVDPATLTYVEESPSHPLTLWGSRIRFLQHSLGTTQL